MLLIPLVGRTLSGKRVRPKEIGFCRLPHLKWKLGYEIGFLLFGFFGNSSPSLVQTDGLFAGDADDGTMARMEVFDEGFGLGTEMHKVFAALEFIASAAVKVVHQDVFVRIVQFEYAGAFHVRTGSGIRVEICEMFFPRPRATTGPWLAVCRFSALCRSGLWYFLYRRNDRCRLFGWMMSPSMAPYLGANIS